MSTTRVIASVAAVVSTGFVVAGCSDNGQSAAVTAPAGASTMSVVIGTDGDPSAPTNVQYTCPGSGTGTGSVCGPEIIHGRWSKTLEVPVGTEIWIHATNAKDPSTNGSPPNCWITDGAGKESYSKSDGGSCVVQVKAAPPA